MAKPVTRISVFLATPGDVVEDSFQEFSAQQVTKTPRRKKSDRE